MKLEKNQTKICKKCKNEMDRYDIYNKNHKEVKTLFVCGFCYQRGKK